MLRGGGDIIHPCHIIKKLVSYTPLHVEITGVFQNTTQNSFYQTRRCCAVWGFCRRFSREWLHQHIQLKNWEKGKEEEHCMPPFIFHRILSWQRWKQICLPVAYVWTLCFCSFPARQWFYSVYRGTPRGIFMREYWTFLL